MQPIATQQRSYMANLPDWLDAIAGAALLSAAWHLAVSVALTQWADYLVDLSDGDEEEES
jgi:hypothetical protein